MSIWYCKEHGLVAGQLPGVCGICGAATTYATIGKVEPMTDPAIPPALAHLPIYKWGHENRTFYSVEDVAALLTQFEKQIQELQHDTRASASQSGLGASIASTIPAVQQEHNYVKPRPLSAREREEAGID